MHDGTRVLLMEQTPINGAPGPTRTVPHRRTEKAIPGRHSARHVLRLLMGPLQECDAGFS